MNSRIAKVAKPQFLDRNMTTFAIFYVTSELRKLRTFALDRNESQGDGRISKLYAPFCNLIFILIEFCSKMRFWCFYSFVQGRRKKAFENVSFFHDYVMEWTSHTFWNVMSHFLMLCESRWILSNHYKEQRFENGNIFLYIVKWLKV